MAYIDRINLAMPEGRIVVRDGQILLKDKGYPMSMGYKEAMRQFATFAEEEKHLGESDFGECQIQPAI